ncbi:hypothetical protein L596_019951 [Steinernema carpocapsae]|uniref:GH18 domain-containing protein n=1 Tax=Steinernema carpocapsae TaxID=34508 RepID=A0A4U5MS28_STECR|nr:hypothetical protein L596_019951 [Steinernema carpocapsae]
MSCFWCDYQRSTMKLLIVLLGFITVVAGMSDKIISCYTRPNEPTPSQIDPYLCTHIMILGSTYINKDCTPDMPNPSQILPMLDLKQDNSDLNIFLTLTPSNPTMSKLVQNEDLMHAYVANVTAYLLKYELDGFDLDWEFPAWSPDANPIFDKAGLTALLKIFRTAFDAAPRKLELSLAVAGPMTIPLKSYNISALNQYADFVQIMNYDFHDWTWYLEVTGFNAPLYQDFKKEWPVFKDFNSNFTLHLYMNGGLAPEKIVFGIPTYARGYELLTNDLHYDYAPATGPSKMFGDDLTFPQVCAALNSGNFTVVWDDMCKSPYFWGQKQWVSYENKKSITFKAAYAKDHHLRGIMLFDLPTDDYLGQCNMGTRYPLIRSAKRAFLGV